MCSESIKVVFYIKKTKLLKNGEAPIYCRISNDTKRSEFALKQSIAPALWNSDLGAVDYKSSSAKIINKEIGKVRFKIEQLMADLEIDNEFIDPVEIKDAFINEKQNSYIMHIFNEHNDTIEKLKGIDFTAATVTKYKTLLKHLEGFLLKQYARDDFPARRIDTDFIKKFEIFLKVELSIGHNTTTKYLQSFNKIVKIAYRKGLIRTNPFDSYKLRLQKIDKEYLTIDEINRIRNKEINITRIDEVRDVFIFCSFTGLAFADAKTLKQSDIKEGIDKRLWIIKKRYKTGQPINVPLIKQAIDILNKYRDFSLKNTSNLLLPVKSNQKMNLYLKEIADICGINKYVTTHTARHTFATTVALDSGLSLEATSKMLGHSNINMTSHYAKTTEKLVSKNFERMISRFEQN